MEDSRRGRCCATAGARARPEFDVDSLLTRCQYTDMDARASSPADRQRAATRTAILDAALHMVHEEPSLYLTHENVAEQAGVSGRTVYRHFPTRADLTLALWQCIRDRTGTRWPRAEEDIIPFLRVTYSQFDTHEALTRAALSAASNTQHSVHGSHEGRAAFREVLLPVLGLLPEDEGDRLVAACLAIYSAPFWQMLRDRGQLSAREAQEAGASAMNALLNSARARIAELTTS